METIQQQLIVARRNIILDAAIEVIGKKGFQRTTIKEIAKQAAVADGTIYNYFKNKDALLVAIVERLSEAEISELETADFEQSDPQTFIASFVKNRMQEIEANMAAIKVILPETIINETISKTMYQTIYEPGFAIGEHYFQQLMDDGVIKTVDPKIAARLFAGSLFGLLFMRLMGDEHIAQNWDAYGDAVSEFLQKAFQTSDEPTDGESNES